MTEKERVLAKCGDAEKSIYKWIPIKGTTYPLSCYKDALGREGYMIGGESYPIRLILAEHIHEDSEVWPIAAQILGIGDEEQAELRFVCKVGLGTAKAGNFMYHVIKWNVKVLSSICVGCKQYTKGQMSRGQAEVMLEFRDSKSKEGFASDTGIALEVPAKVHLNSGQIAGEPQRLANDLLWEAFQKGNEITKMRINLLVPCFESWLSTLPPDPLEADREFVKKVISEIPAWGVIEINKSSDLFLAIKRLAGMEVSNG